MRYYFKHPVGVGFACYPKCGMQRGVVNKLDDEWAPFLKKSLSEIFPFRISTMKKRNVYKGE